MAKIDAAYDVLQHALDEAEKRGTTMAKGDSALKKRSIKLWQKLSLPHPISVVLRFRVSPNT